MSIKKKSKDKKNPFLESEIGLTRKFKGKFPVIRCRDPFALSGLARNLKNFKAMISLEVDDECRIMSEREFISPRACEEYGDYSLSFFGSEKYYPPS